MRQIQFHVPGEPAAVVTCAEVADPVVTEPDDVLVRVDLFPINPADILTLQGVYPRSTPGSVSLGVEATGIVRDIGSAVRDVRIGDRVLLLGADNWSELRRVTTREVVPLSGAIDPRRAACLKVNPGTAALLLTEFATLRPGDWIAQNAATSAVGRAVARLAGQRGLRIVNVVRRPGTNPVLDPATVVVDGPDLRADIAARTNGEPIRLAFDAVAGEATGRLAASVADGGTLVMYGAMSGQSARINPAALVFRDVRVRGFWLTRWLAGADPARIRPIFQELERLAEPLDLTPPIDSVLDAVDIAAAVTRAAEIGSAGKVLVRF